MFLLALLILSWHEEKLPVQPLCIWDPFGILSFLYELIEMTGVYWNVKTPLEPVWNCNIHKMYLVFYALDKVHKRFRFYPPSLTHSYSHTHKHNIGFLLRLCSSVEISWVHAGCKSNDSHSLKDRGELHLQPT